MEPLKEPMRIRLVLGKFQVQSVDKGTIGVKFKLAMGNAVTMNCDSPITADVRVGDWLTLYTEVLTDAPAIATPIQ